MLLDGTAAKTAGIERARHMGADVTGMTRIAINSSISYWRALQQIVIAMRVALVAKSTELSILRVPRNCASVGIQNMLETPLITDFPRVCISSIATREVKSPLARRISAVKKDDSGPPP